MCGIAGCVARPGDVPDRAALERMAEALRPRGPDDGGIEINGNVGLVSRRLAIVDPGPAGHQPMADAAGRWLVAYNGEIYNHLELRERLPDLPWRGHSDTETLVEALAAWGPEAVDRCNGPLAFAALDREGQRLLLARDRFGKKPLYIARHGGRLWFASEIRALLEAGIPRRAQVDALRHAAIRGWAYGRLTPLEGIERLPQGTVAEVGLRTLATSQRHWYDPTDSVDPELGRELESLSRPQLVERVEEALRGAVRRRLMSDVPLGTMCSGGLDSSLITALTREQGGSVAAVNCSLPDEPRADEARWAERVARALDIELETVTLDSAGWRSRLVAAVRSHEYPLAGSGAVPIASMAGIARQRGIKVLLTGEGADELFAGYAYLHVPEERAFLPSRTVVRRDLRAIRRRRFPWRRALDRLHLRRQDPVPDQAPESARARREAREAAGRAYSHHDPVRARWEAALLTDITCSSFPYLLNRMDKDAMSRSVETRVPFLDPEVVAIGLNLPLEARALPRRKGILPEVGARHLPPEIVKRPKYPGMNFDARRRIEQAAHPDFLRRGLLRELLGQSEREWDDQIGRGHHMTGLRLWTGEIWARLFLEGESVEAVERDLWL